MKLLAAVIIVATLIGVAVGRYPWLKMNRATIALAFVPLEARPFIYFQF